MAKAFLLALMTSTGWGAVCYIPFLKSLVWPGLEPESSPSKSDGLNIHLNDVFWISDMIYWIFWYYHNMKKWKTTIMTKKNIYSKENCSPKFFYHIKFHSFNEYLKIMLETLGTRIIVKPGQI
jgi:hypothetical protein